jgi:4-methoxybenzoate monooxygenase (O-demethylating)
MSKNLPMNATIPRKNIFPASELDPFSDEFLSSPHRYHEEIREAGPVVWLEKYGVWAMARYEQVHAALSDWETYCSSAGVGLSDFRKEKPWRTPGLLLEADPPLHTRTRNVMMRVVSRPAIEALRESFTKEAIRLLDELVARGSFDAVTDLAEKYPLKVFPDAVGLPKDGREKLLPYGSMVFNAFGPRNQLFEDAMVNAKELLEWAMTWCQRSALTSDGFGARIYEAADAEKVSEAEAALLVRSFISAGLDTTVHALGDAIYCFATNPDQWQLLRDDLSLARPAFEEVIRCESPVQTFFRTTTKPVNVAGVQLGEGEKVLLFLAAANRDPRKWDNPERFDIRRKTLGHVGFGFGIHACVGQAVARMEGEIILTELAKRVEKIQLVGEPKLQINNTLRGWASLPVAVS